ncbi:L,D-transpeptidase family protein [Bifidobacterium pullorum subsp. saeculare]|uniref:L,D-transpeptidase family protein n=1 Tax=Bifidobacterium pullorum subsp. saeculare TaxID=78257 RepID=A0A938WXA5_9BIFI|nr:L,D-transpeptidase family protein [Bifidobacterium pullorum]MBM6699616.1 L,D-transpeptidase family protein [Bifidobacterium pullorum subsp. saeculare]
MSYELGANGFAGVPNDDRTEVITPVGGTMPPVAEPVAMAMPPEGGAVAPALDQARHSRKPLVIALVAIGLVIAALVAAFFTLRWYYADRVAPGVSFGNTKVVGLDRDALTDAVESTVKATTITVTDTNGGKVTASLKDLGADVDVNKTVDALLGAKAVHGVGDEFARLYPFDKVSVPLSATTDDYAMSTFLTDRLVTEDDRAVASTVAYDGNAKAFVATAGRDGKAPEAGGVAKAVDAAIASPGTGHTVNVVFKSVAMPVSAETATDAANAANQRLAAPIVITNGDQKEMTIPADQIAAWTKPQVDVQKGTIALAYDQDAIKAYLAQTMPAELNQDMVKEKNVVNKDGGAVLYQEVKGVNGVAVKDTDATAAAVTQALDGGQGGTLTAQTDVTKFETENRVVDYTSPNGDPHAMIDLSSQTASFYKGSTLVKTFQVSTGAPGHDTPRGTFFVQRKLSSDNMRGPGYFTPNVPWCTYFTFSGVAFHGAPWNPGGIASGTPKSHGCINMNVGDAKWAYDFLPVGAMVEVNGSTPAGAVR